jgi:hypothetical protein
MRYLKKLMLLCIAFYLISCYGISLAAEPGNCRLLSLSESEKLILVSQIPSKTKYLLDASSAKITVNGKPAEFGDLKAYSVIQVKMVLRKSNKNGITINGSATEIRVLNPDNPQ